MDKSALTVRVYTAYEGRMVLPFQQHRAGRSEYLACRVSQDTWDGVEATASRASGVPMATMKAKIQDFLSGKVAT